ncbi:hypothetical protein BRC87_12330 [Halobacteriales archaeon QS_4_66_20]|nr:MAG: hypothetical protein BRC87_12330 [Halobacteriales archaeon QS_4_66_20]
MTPPTLAGQRRVAAYEGCLSLTKETSVLLTITSRRVKIAIKILSLFTPFCEGFCKGSILRLLGLLADVSGYLFRVYFAPFKQDPNLLISQPKSFFEPSFGPLVCCSLLSYIWLIRRVKNLIVGIVVVTRLFDTVLDKIVKQRWWIHPVEERDRFDDAVFYSGITERALKITALNSARPQSFLFIHSVLGNRERRFEEIAGKLWMSQDGHIQKRIPDSFGNFLASFIRRLTRLLVLVPLWIIQIFSINRGQNPAVTARIIDELVGVNHDSYKTTLSLYNCGAIIGD